MALKSFRDRSPITVGLVSLTALVLAIAGTFLTGTMGLLKNRYEMSGVFSDTGGLRDGNNVLVAGVQVGEVTAVEPDFGKGLVLVKWKVDRGIDLGPQTRAEIRMSNILGGRYLRLTGPVTTPYLADQPESRRRIPLERTRTPITVNEVLKEGATLLKGIDAKTFSKVIDQLGGLSEESRKKLSRSLSNLVDLAEELNTGQGRITELLDNSDRILKIVKEKDATLSTLVNNAMTLLEVLRQRRTQLTLLLGGGSSAVRSVGDLISDQQKQLNQIIGDLQHTMDTLDPKVDELNTALAWAGPTLSAFASIGQYGNFTDVIFSQIGQVSPGDLAQLAQMLKESQ
ncbi:MlaD family protein [Actinocorallia sp. B10E7]|uniref:MlaD family protein n=1 Tax=Actinocorallia sp. B10E7 TaxID=3153558 RepID=UPI00325D980B